jgi:phosphoenolpyruvate carboxykinase (ATP)
LGERIAKHEVDVWLVNTGWTGGAYGIGRRMPIALTRTLLASALSGDLRNAPMRPDCTFGFAIPQSCPEVPSEILNARDTWSDPAAYDQQAARLAQMFVENFATFSDRVPAAVSGAGARVRVMP